MTICPADVRRAYVHVVTCAVPRRRRGVDCVGDYGRSTRAKSLVLATPPISVLILPTRREGVASMRVPFSYSSVRPMDKKLRPLISRNRSSDLDGFCLGWGDGGCTGVAFALHLPKAIGASCDMLIIASHESSFLLP